MSEHIFYDEDNNKIEVWCIECGARFEISCTPEQYERLNNRTDLIQKIFPELSPDIRELFISGLCGICFDGTTGFFRHSTPEMDKRAHDLHKRLYPEIGEKILCKSVQDLYHLYKDIQGYITDYEDSDWFEPKAYDDLKEVTGALKEFTKEIEKL